MLNGTIYEVIKLDGGGRRYGAGRTAGETREEAVANAAFLYRVKPEALDGEGGHPLDAWYLVEYKPPQYAR